MLQRIIPAKPEELSAVLWSSAYFFCLLCGYYILRPVRDEMGIQGGVDNLQWAFTGTFLAMLLAVPLFSAVAARYPRRKLLPLVYWFFTGNILLFYALFQSELATALTARAFFIWVSVFNLFVVSVFWSFMADLFPDEQARRLFAPIAAGGSAGAIVGPALSAVLATIVGPTHLLLISALFLGLAVLCIHRLVRWADHRQQMGRGVPSDRATAAETAAHQGADEPIGGGLLSGVQRVFRSRYLLGICLYIVLYTTLSTFLYFEQAHIVAEAFDDSGERTRVFASIDVAVNLLTVFAQVFVTSRIIARLGLPLALALVPALVTLGFIALGLFPLLTVLIAAQIIRRAGNYAIAKPAREMLFTVVSREERYKSKNFIDTVVYRGGDAVSGWLFAGLNAVGLGLSAIAFIAAPLAALWLATGLALGKKQGKMAHRLS